MKIIHFFFPDISETLKYLLMGTSSNPDDIEVTFYFSDVLVIFGTVAFIDCLLSIDIFLQFFINFLAVIFLTVNLTVCRHQELNLVK